ncbi:MAG: FAD-dependent oxidoreductase [Patescibacteria group bacterium]
MKIGIIGAGISGLSAAYQLTKEGHSVTIFERSDTVGGLGTYISIKGNYIERFYHHFFETDTEIIQLARELGISKKLKYYKAKTGIYTNGRIYQFSSAFNLLFFKPLSLVDRIRCGIVFGFLKFLPFAIDSLDNISAKKWILRYAGKNIYQKIWGPLLEGKFSSFFSYVSALWLWGRIRDRSPKLGYFDGSVKILFDKLTESIIKSGGKIKLNVAIRQIKSTKKGVLVSEEKNIHDFDKVIITTVSSIATKIIKNKLPSQYKKSLNSIDHLGAVCLIVELKKPLQSQYWLNICDKKAPVLVLVEHTNMIDKSNYDGNTVVYLANYIHRNDKRFKTPDDQLIKQYLGFLKNVNKDYNDSWVIKSYISRVPRAQTIFKTNSLKKIPPIKTPLSNIYMINIDQMYPHDRNLHQGAYLGKKVASIILNKKIK